MNSCLVYLITFMLPSLSSTCFHLTGQWATMKPSFGTFLSKLHCTVVLGLLYCHSVSGSTDQRVISGRGYQWTICSQQRRTLDIVDQDHWKTKKMGDSRTREFWENVWVCCLRTCFRGGGWDCCVWAASVRFCPRPKLTILADKPLAGRSVCLSSQ